MSLIYIDINVANQVYTEALRLGASDKVILATFATALVESGCRNLPYGDRDSLGVFQQRPSQGWGTPSQIMDVEYATEQFVTRAQKRENNFTDPGVLAQAVQVSAFPDRYRQRISDAQALLDLMRGRVGSIAAPVFHGTVLSYPPGTSGNDARIWQDRMNVLVRAGLLADGHYGPASRAATMKFQNDRDLTPDGQVGPITWNEAWR